MGNEGAHSKARRADADLAEPIPGGGVVPSPPPRWGSLYFIAPGLLAAAALLAGLLFTGMRAVTPDPKTSRLQPGQLVMFVAEERYSQFLDDSPLQPGMKGDTALVIGDNSPSDSPDRQVEVKILDGKDSGKTTARSRSQMVPVSERPSRR